MNTFRQNALAAGLLFVVADVVGPFAFPALGFLNEPNYLATTAGHSNSLMVGVLLILTMELACSGIAVWLYPILRKEHEAMALWSVIFRAIEALCGIVAAVALLALIPLSQGFLAAGMPEVSAFQALGTLIVSTSDWTRDVVMLFAWGLGALLYNILFFKSGLLPRWLAGWGIVGILVHMASCVLRLFDVIGPTSPLQLAMLAPSALQELTLALWLIVKGFDQAAVARLTTRQFPTLEPREPKQTSTLHDTGAPQPHAAL